MMQEAFRPILEELEAGRSAVLHRTVDGVEYTRLFRPRERLILLGGGHIAQPLCRMAAMLDFDVTVVDDRPDFAAASRFPEAAHTVCDAFAAAIAALKLRESDYVCVITRGHRWDADCLRQILSGAMPSYLGMIGSRRRVAGLMRLLQDEGYDAEKLAAIHAPIGLAIGAKTAEEIALSILAEIVQIKSARPLTEGFSPAILAALGALDTPAVLATIVSRHGSTPREVGSKMLLLPDGRTVGSVGGGIMEYRVQQLAAKMLAGEEPPTKLAAFTTDGTGEDAAIAACGGSMNVLLQRMEPEENSDEA